MKNFLLIQKLSKWSDETINKAVDFLFESMALELGSRAISIILSGLEGDGSLGAKQINQMRNHHCSVAIICQISIYA